MPRKVKPVPLQFYTIAADGTVGMTHRRWRLLADRLDQAGEAPALVAKIRRCLSDNPADAPMVVEIAFPPAVVARFAAAAQALADPGV